MKRPKSPNAKTPSGQDEPLFVTWGADGKGRTEAVAAASRSLARSEPVVFRANALSSYKDVAPGNVSIREGFDRADYDYFRPGERTPRNQLENVMACMKAYERVGLVRNVIDMMSDFVVQGIDLVHRSPGIEKWHKAWFAKVAGKERSERQASTLLRAATAVVQRHTAKLSITDEETFLRSFGASDSDWAPAKPKSREVPISYTVHNPLQVEVLGGELALFTGTGALTYGLRIPDHIVRTVKSPKSKTEKELVARLPKQIRQAILDGTKVVPLDSDKVRALYYKRDDWQIWPTPMLSPVLSDLKLYDKLKLADLAALDGAISHIRLWKLGSLEHRILPTEHAINRLADVLTNNVGGGSIDLIWGPELELQETDTSIHQFLGATKYQPVLEAIYAGLGIPPTLTGSGSGGFTNNFISLRTLTERLQYIRDIIISFWLVELRLVQQAMGFRFPAELVFDRLSLTDEAAEKQLLLHLLDRNVISEESVLKHFDEIPEIERIRKRREQQARESGQLPSKAGPFHDPQEDFALQKIALQSGQATPSEVGLELDDKTRGEKSMLDRQEEQTDKQLNAQTELADKQHKMQKDQIKDGADQRDHDYKMTKLQLKHGVHPAQLANDPKGQPGQGRPKLSKDSTKRKPKAVKPRAAATFIETSSWAEEAQRAVAEYTAPAFLAAQGKKNRRQLTEAEFGEFEKFTFAVLCNLPACAEVTEETIKSTLSKPLAVPAQVLELKRATVSRFTEKEGKEPSVDKVRQIQAQVYALYHTDLDLGGV